MTPAKGYMEMKDSGIEWVGMIPAHWGICKIKYTVTQETLRAENNGGYIGLEKLSTNIMKMSWSREQVLLFVLMTFSLENSVLIWQNVRLQKKVVAVLPSLLLCVHIL